MRDPQETGVVISDYHLTQVSVVSEIPLTISLQSAMADRSTVDKAATEFGTLPLEVSLFCDGTTMGAE